MRTARRLLGIACAMAGCSAEPFQDRELQAGEWDELDWAGEWSDGMLDAADETPGAACDRSRCLDGATLSPCAADEALPPIDCVANRGTCVAGEAEDRCVADGWDCSTRCLDLVRRQICWVDLSVTVVDCSALGSDLFCNDGPADQPSCGLSPPSLESAPPPPSETPAPPPQAPCCEEGCPCDLDCMRDHPSCASVETAENWWCDPYTYGAGDACDCECGLPDPDCEDPTLVVWGCLGPEQTCDPYGHCVFW